MTALDRLVARRDQSSFLAAQQLQRRGLVGQLVTAASGPVVWLNGRRIVSFASSSYLGLVNRPAVYQSSCLAAKRWGMTLSQPRMWATDLIADRLEQELANLVGQERALLFASTTHIAFDLLPLLAGPRGVIFVDEWAYSISYAAAQYAAKGGSAVREFRHNDPMDLEKRLKAQPQISEKVIVCDGLYMPAGRTVELQALCQLANKYDAIIYLDDAQGLGLLGTHPDWMMPYGYGGGGTPSYWGAGSGRIAYVSTLAKGFGVPLAFVAGPKDFIQYLGNTSFSVIHSSPPALPLVAAARATMRLNAAIGDKTRCHLLKNIRYFRDQLASVVRTRSPDHLLPMQTLYFPRSGQAAAAAGYLRQHGIWPIIQLHPIDYPQGGALRFIITADHRKSDLDELLTVLSQLSLD